MINIALAKDWRIKSDRHQYILVQQKGKREFVQGYYPNLESCINGYIQMGLRLSDANSVLTLIEYIKQLQTSLNKALQPLNLEVKPVKINEVIDK